MRREEQEVGILLWYHDARKGLTYVGHEGRESFRCTEGAMAGANRQKARAL